MKNRLEEIKKNHLPILNERLSADENIDNTGDYPRLNGDFYKNQLRIALRNYDIIDPDSIEDYISLGGYEGLRRAIFENSPQETVDEIKKSGLRGRGGAGFPTGIKWQTALDAKNSKKYVICNADEGDPGAYMDRSILEGDPHSVLEGMAICAKAIGADEGFIYVRAEYPEAVNSLTKAIKIAEEYNLLGDNIMGSDFNFHISLRLGSGAFVCGEGTALIQSIEGKRGMPQVKTYRTAVRGLFDKPTIINNVETFANVGYILKNGAESFSKIGTEDSTGTKVFALVGKVKNSGLVEVPMGTTIREIVFDIGGGVKKGRKIKAVQTGGPSGGCIPEEFFDTPIDFGSLKKIGSIMGSGGMVVMDDTDCMIDIAKYFMNFTVSESCGKCTPCREGTMRMLEILEKITSGDGTEDMIEEMENLGEYISNVSLCGLGQTSCNPVLSTLKYFRNEYDEHIINKKCSAGACKDLSEYFITENCIGCNICQKNCPADCISGDSKERHKIDREKCLKCGECFENCPVDGAIVIR